MSERHNMLDSCDTNEKIAVAELRNELHESDLLRERMDRLLTRTACALKGDPAELSMHSWHDLPEVAERLKSQRDELLAALEAGRRLIELISPFEGDVTRQMDKAIASVKANA